MDNEEFKKLMVECDCPETLVKMASTKWQKAVAIEFVRNDSRMTRMEGDVSWVKRLTMSIFAVVVIATLAQYIAPALQTIFA